MSCDHCGLDNDNCNCYLEDELHALKARMKEIESVLVSVLFELNDLNKKLKE
jgi:hypothetical protein